jgi:hypothetical protein
VPGPKAKPFAERFWPKVNKTKTCWLWTAGTMGAGYGSFAVARSKSDYAHRVSWNMAYGEIPTGMKVLHECDNPACVRPSHLFLGTSKDNTQDAVAKGRLAKGERHGRAKLSEREAIEILRMVFSGHLHKHVAARFGLSRQHVSDIAGGRKWKHLGEIARG